ncbi:CvpA family protein [Fructobacillus tropaeoli]|uniref:Colicin V production protein n=1 Tax=Fructobacillus tropaeoli TaxID=709323 RepID=A0A3F3H0E1_9LACO|nr:CvpA family protein [Fructobacillus tropaeoli]NLS38798.1 CvpA family protein [Fructobacillus tropaeoli]CAK1238996.1 Colicin V production accessory protein CvpA [Fructobacillus tropaeoli]CAK1245418.1 Colicin V production accessory protein CvpA [Fructobacillus tropaeoli]GAP04555.1 colicin V production protein [Fructobacillus tropaeoli]GIC70707.1 CvpA family protein [Fructobacillus tropaeoli]
MILSLIFAVVIFLMALSGYREGLVHVLARLAIFCLVFYMATVYSKPLADLFSNWVSGQFSRPGVPEEVSRQGTQFLSSGLAFMVVMALGSFVGHYLLRPIRFIRRLPILGALDGLLGGILYLGIGVVLSFVILQVLSVVPNAWLQMQFSQSPILNQFLNTTPVLSNQIYQWWL